MSSSAPVIKPQYRIVILSGPEKGTAYQLMSSQIRIGREKDNDIIITDDPLLSRHHATIEITDNKVEVFDNSQKNKITVNHQRLDRARLRDGMVFTVGTTEMRIERLADEGEYTSSAMVTTAQPLSPSPPAPPRRPPLGMATAPESNPPRRTRRPEPKQSYTGYIVIGIILLLAWVLFSSGGTKKKDEGLRSNDDVESTIKESQAAKEQLRKKNEKLSGNFQDAQALYIQGFRDYKKGQYSRAIESFRGALSINPDHPLAQRYVKLARRRLDELIQFNMVQGRQYRSRDMYDKCAAAFNNVINFSPDRNSPTYKEAKELQEECTLAAKGRY